MTERAYTTQLQAGLGMVDETEVLLDLWEPAMSATQLYQVALDSGRFPTMSARRLRNLVAECFSPRLMTDGDRPANQLKLLHPKLSSRELEQMLFLYACRANAILADFVREVYWRAYTSGRDVLSNQDARDFVTRANQDGLTTKPWSEGTVRRVAAYLTGACADFGLLEHGQRVARKVLPFRIERRAAIILAYDLHFMGLGDNSIVAHADWGLFGLERSDVLDELRRLSLKGLFIVQTAGDVTRIGWKCRDIKELADVIAES